jgi:hypothetical protein
LVSTTARIGVERSGASGAGCNYRLRDLLSDVGRGIEENPAAAVGRCGQARLRSLPHACASCPGGAAEPVVAVPLGKTAAGRRSDDFQTHRHSPIFEIHAPECTTTARLPLPDASRQGADRKTARAYFLGVISAGRYREISKPAATWHMVGLVQIFFIPFLLCTGPT